MGSIAAVTSSRAPERPRQRRLAVTACHRCLQRQLVAARPQLLHSTRRAGSAAALKSGSGAQQQAGAVNANQGLAAAEDAEQRQAGAGALPAGQQEATPGVKAALGALKFYKGFISPLLPNACRFLPTCSAYSMDAFQRHGVSKGFVLTAWRLLRCNPWGNSGYDPVRWPPPGLEAIFGGADGGSGGGGSDGGSGGSGGK